MKFPKIASLLGLGLALAACDIKLPQRENPGPNLPGLELAQDRFGRTAEPAVRPEALSLKEVSFHLRMKLPDAELIAEAKKRGLAIEGDAPKALAQAQASPALIAQLTAPEILLTKAELQLYERRLAAQTSRRSVEAAQSEDFVDQNRAALNKSLAATRRQQIERQTAELTAKANRIREEQRHESYSRNSDSPYQRRQQEIDQINREIAALNQQLR